MIVPHVIVPWASHHARIVYVGCLTHVDLARCRWSIWGTGRSTRTTFENLRLAGHLKILSWPVGCLIMFGISLMAVGQYHFSSSTGVTSRLSAISHVTDLHGGVQRWCNTGLPPGYWHLHCWLLTLWRLFHESPPSCTFDVKKSPKAGMWPRELTHTRKVCRRGCEDCICPFQRPIPCSMSSGTWNHTMFIQLRTRTRITLVSARVLIH